MSEISVSVADMEGGGDINFGSKWEPLYIHRTEFSNAILDVCTENGKLEVEDPEVQKRIVAVLDSHLEKRVRNALAGADGKITIEDINNFNNNMIYAQRESGLSVSVSSESKPMNEKAHIRLIDHKYISKQTLEAVFDSSISYYYGSGISEGKNERNLDYKCSKYNVDLYEGMIPLQHTQHFLAHTQVEQLWQPGNDEKKDIPGIYYPTIGSHVISKLTTSKPDVIKGCVLSEQKRMGAFVRELMDEVENNMIPIFSTKLMFALNPSINYGDGDVLEEIQKLYQEIKTIKKNGGKAVAESADLERKINETPMLPRGTKFVLGFKN